jgi:hypothetical protein
MYVVTVSMHDCVTISLTIINKANKKCEHHVHIVYFSEASCSKLD